MINPMGLEVFVLSREEELLRYLQPVPGLEGTMVEPVQSRPTGVSKVRRFLGVALVGAGARVGGRGAAFTGDDLAPPLTEPFLNS